MQNTDHDAKPIVLAITSLILALPFPILIIVLWSTVNAIKGMGEAVSSLTMNAVFLYLVQFFVIPVLAITSVVIALIVTAKWKGQARIDIDSDNLTIGLKDGSMGGAKLGLCYFGIFLKPNERCFQGTVNNFAVID